MLRNYSESVVKLVSGIIFEFLSLPQDGTITIGSLKSSLPSTTSYLIFSIPIVLFRNSIWKIVHGFIIISRNCKKVRKLLKGSHLSASVQIKLILFINNLVN